MTTTTEGDEAVAQSVTTDTVTIKPWLWRGPAGETVNCFVEADAGKLRDRATGEAEIARTVALFERSLRAALVRPDQGVVLRGSAKQRGRR